MEAFSLLKYWRGGGTTVGGGGVSACVNPRSGTTSGSTTTIVTAVTTHQVVDTDDDDDDDGPFFDLEFAVPDEDETEDTEENEVIVEGENVEDEESENLNDDGDTKSDEDFSDGEREFNFTLSSGSSNDRSDSNLTLSPSDDLFFKGRLVPIEPNSSLDTKPPQFPVSLLKSATKFRVFLLKLKKSKLNNSTDKTESASANDSVSVPEATPEKQETTQEENKDNSKNKFLTVKFKVEEVPIISLFSRDNSKSQKQQSSENCVSDEKKFSKDVMQKYLKKVKPLYVRVSRRYVEKLRFSGQLNSLKPSTPSSAAAQKPVTGKVTTAEKEKVEMEVGENQLNGKNLKQGTIPAGLRVVCKHLGKSRSASSAVAAVPSPPTLSNRRDDSLLQQQDGIQSAILHCKKSFNGSRDASESSILPRSISDPSHEKSINLSRKPSADEDKA